MTPRRPSTPTGRSLADGELDGLTAMLVQIEDESRFATVQTIRAEVLARLSPLSAAIVSAILEEVERKDATCAACGEPLYGLARTHHEAAAPLDPALRALVEAWDGFDPATPAGAQQISVVVEEARAALAATDAAKGVEG